MADPTSASPMPVPRPRQRPNNSAIPDKVNNNSGSFTLNHDEPDCPSNPSIPSLYPKLDPDTVPSLYRKLDYENFEILHPKVQNNYPEQPPEAASSRPVPAPRRTKVVVQEEDQEG